MQIFKNFLLACSIAVATSPLYLQAGDTDAQAAARAALAQKMRELKGGSATSETPAALPASTPAPENSKAQPVAPPMSEPPATTPTNAPATFSVPGGASPDLIEQARQATRTRMSELQSHRTTAIPAGRETVAPEPAVQFAPEPGTTKVVAPAGPSKAELRAVKEREAAEKRAAAEHAAAAKKAAKEQAAKEKAEAEAAAKAAKFNARPAPVAAATTDTAQKKAEAEAGMKAEADAKAKAAADAKARAAAEKAAAKGAKKTKPAPAVVEAPVMLTPLEAPASSLPSAKDQALKSLTEQYQADKISAEEYHQQRAKILAEP